MNLADLLIVIVLVGSVVSAFVKGFFVEVFSLAGVILGLFIAAANYGRIAPWILTVVQTGKPQTWLRSCWLCCW